MNFFIKLNTKTTFPWWLKLLTFFLTEIHYPLDYFLKPANSTYKEIKRLKCYETLKTKYKLVEIKKFFYILKDNIATTFPYK